MPVAAQPGAQTGARFHFVPRPSAARRGRHADQLSALATSIAEVDEAAAHRDAGQMATALLPLLDLVDDDIGFDIVAVIELARLDLDLAVERWDSIRGRAALLRPRV